MENIQIILEILTSSAPAMATLSGIIGTIVTVILAVKKLTVAVNDLKHNDDLKEVIKCLNIEREESKRLRKMNESLLQELKRIKPLGGVDDEKD